MKFIVSSTALLKGLQKINGVISSNTVLPILEDFLIHIKGKQMRAFATDLETSMSTDIELAADPGGEFKVAIQARLLLDILKTLPEQPISVSVDEVSYAVEITSDNGKYKLAGENGEDFPKLPVEQDATEISIPADVLLSAINKTLFAVSNEELRPAMTGMLWEFGTDQLTFVSTDAHKLVRYARRDIAGGKGNSIIVPKKALNLLKATLPAGQEVRVAYDTSNAFLSFGNTNLICRLIDARYPDYNAVIPTENPNLLAMNRDDLYSSMRRISIFANKTTHQVVLKMAGKELQVSAEDLDFSNAANETLVCDYTGNDMAIGFNAKFLLEMLGSLDSEEIRLELSTPNRAGILRPSEQDPNEDLLMLVMPVMINNQ